MVKACDLKEGDVIRLFDGAFSDARVYKIEDKGRDISLFYALRPYIMTMDGIAYIGHEDFSAYVYISDRTYEVVK